MIPVGTLCFAINQCKHNHCLQDCIRIRYSSPYAASPHGPHHKLHHCLTVLLILNHPLEPPKYPVPVHGKLVVVFAWKKVLSFN